MKDSNNFENTDNLSLQSDDFDVDSLLKEIKEKKEKAKEIEKENEDFHSEVVKQEDDDDNFDMNEDDKNENKTNSDEDEIKERPHLTRKERVDMLKEQRKKNKHLQKEREKAIKKQARSNEKREVLSYEDMPLSTRDEHKSGKNFLQNIKFTKKRIILCVAIILVLSLLVFCFAMRDSLSFDNIRNFVVYGIFNTDSEERFPIDIQGASVDNGNFTRMGRSLAYSSDTSFSVYNNYGKCLFNSQISYSDPVLVTTNSKSLIYNLGGKGFSINSIDKNLYDTVSDNYILCADIIDNGTYALVTTCDGYLSKLFVYDEENTQIFAYSFADYYVTSVSLDSSGNRAIVSGVSAYEGSEMSAVYVLDFRKPDPLIFKEFENNIVYNVKFLSDNHCSIIGNTACYSLKVNKEEFNEYSYDSKKLTAFDVNADTDTFTVSLSRSGDSRNCDIVCFNADGKATNTITTELAVTSMSTYKNRIALLSEGEIYLFDRHGRQLSHKNGGVEPHAVVLYDSNSAYVLNVSEITRIDL